MSGRSAGSSEAAFSKLSKLAGVNCLGRRPRKLSSTTKLLKKAR
jgi:hypothetical protein